MKKEIPFIHLLLWAFIAIGMLDSCHSSKKATKSKPSSQSNGQQSTYTPSAFSPAKGDKKKRKAKEAYPPATEESGVKESTIAAKYAPILGVSKKDITNYALYKFIDSWYGVPYKFAGRTKSGVDCSDLASLLFQSVFCITIGGNVTDIYRRCIPIKGSELQEGDLVFFKINSKSLSHVGIYLQNHKFVHASVHAGVVISDLGEDYYRKYFWGAGRLLK